MNPTPGRQAVADPKHCGRLTDHPPHQWKSRGRSTVIQSDDDWATHFRSIGPRYHCKGQITVEGGHW